MTLTIFYDGQCPLCMTEINQLQKLNHKNNLNFVNLHDENFTDRYPHIDPAKAERIIHGETENGTLLLGLDVTCTAWILVEKHRWLKILRWPLIRNIADLIYRLFARYRHRISRLIMGKQICDQCKIN